MAALRPAALELSPCNAGSGLPESSSTYPAGLVQPHGIRLGVGVGGTFTDAVLTGAGASAHVAKVLSTPDDPSRAALEAMAMVLDEAGLSWSDVREVVHGSSIATNALVEREVGTTGLVTTLDARDAAHPLVPPELVRNLDERVDDTGAVVTPLAENDVFCAAHALAQAGAVSLAIVLRNAARNPSHERHVAALIEAAFPAMEVTISSDIAGDASGRERVAATVANAALRPPMRYVKHLGEELAALGYRRGLMVIQSDGAMVLGRAAARQPVRLVPSGGAARRARQVEAGDHVAIDVGGTSCEIAIVAGGVRPGGPGGPPLPSADANEASHVVGIAAVGTGGGSVAHIADGALAVGPLSVGGRPGPACFGEGGTQFTLTDALLLLGLIAPERFLGGRMRLDPGLAEAAAGPLCATLGLTPLALAQRVHDTAVATIAAAVGQLVAAQERGWGGRAIVPSGGAGAMLAAAVAEAVGLGEVIVRDNPAISACGLTTTQARPAWPAPVVDVGRLRWVGTLPASTPIPRPVATGVDEAAASKTAGPPYWRRLDRARLALHGSVDGPAIIAEDTTATVVPHGWRVSLRPDGSLHLVR